VHVTNIEDEHGSAGERDGDGRVDHCSWVVASGVDGAETRQIEE